MMRGVGREEEGREEGRVTGLEEGSAPNHVPSRIQPIWRIRTCRRRDLEL